MTEMEEGQICPVHGCAGVLGYAPVQECRCHLSPPCSACTENPLVCLTCGEQPEEDP